MSVLERLAVGVPVVALVCFGALAGGADKAQSEHGAELPLVLDELVLNGAGTRRVMFAKLYTCRLFVPREISSFDEARSLDGPIEIQLEVHGEPPGSLPDDWEKVLDEELSQQLFRKAQAHYRRLEEGDRVVVAYLPGEGSTVWLNGEKRFTDPGPGLVLALLEQWVGERPVSKSLRRSLLGQGNS